MRINSKKRNVNRIETLNNKVKPRFSAYLYQYLFQKPNNYYNFRRTKKAKFYVNSSMSIFSNVWIIDDSEMDNYLNKMILQTLNYAHQIDSFSNPTKALKDLKEMNEKREKDKIPDIIFLDINMPLMNGFEFLEEFEKFPQELFSHVRFYLISSSEDPEDVEKIKKFPKVLKYLNKPLDKNELN